MAVENGPAYKVYSYCSNNHENSRPGRGTIEESPVISIQENFSMVQNYQNPFSTITIIRYTLTEDAQVSLEVYNNLGQKVAQLEKGKLSAGYHQARFDAAKLAAGIYLYRLQAVNAENKQFVINKKMVVAK